MSTAASRKWTNIRRSIQSRIGNFVVVNGYSAPIFYDYYYADPDGNRTGSGTYRMWAEAFFIESTAGRKGEAVLQIDCYSRVGEEDDVSSDQFGMEIDDMTDEILAPFSGVDVTGLQNGIFHVMDYADVNNPVDADMCLYMINSQGNIGEPEERKRLDFYQDFRRVTIRLRFQLIQDMAGPVAFYTY